MENHHLDTVLPRLYGAYDSTAEILFDNLPDRFVLKCSHGCKCNIFCTAKHRLDIEQAKQNLNDWMRIDFSTVLGELHYKEMTPKIMCEEFLADDQNHDLPMDYKLFCFGGKPFCTMVATARERNGIAQLAFYDLEWRRKLPYCIPQLETTADVRRPAGYDEMVAVAQELAAPFPFVRMDFYSIGGRAKLGEMTFTPGACISADYMTAVAQTELGALLHLPNRHP